MALRWPSQVLFLGLQTLADPSGLYILGDNPQVAFGSDFGALSVKGDALELTEGLAAVSLSPKLTQLPKVTVNGQVHAETLLVDSKLQWRLLDYASFEEDEHAEHWTRQETSFCGSPQDRFLGGHCQFAAGNVSRRVLTLPPHSKVKVSARVHFLDKWEGEAVTLSVDDRPVWSQSHDWCPGFMHWMCSKYGINSCGRDLPDRLSAKVEATIMHSGPEIGLTFGSSLAPSTDPCYTSWGVDDVSLEIL
uniref:Uncharacterized protein n=1 Tax=Noctiluca scintillans TaxID=2966 RepID=A0A7S1B238_NOCSC|mmetsp:Transcript_88/g.269  ORF Transcript_88/g.269 Transcript_88/m.269 type:complete len:248 (+) Transcript_88:55-798(+)|eukprot:CAMPEP_0194495838 /NCGR_PEP_ID=MMETSP0253-20130528/13308_1 /TAXON_ID=2966 /ORGANISM="Noctiluca scintillans" /LENGTH=247 /DNA_ID=CAMNT_0039337157 /DNA_START=49 /DNA_END=792 /DNA_ORIENTATION=+